MNFTDTPFLTQEDNGTIRVTGSRITLDTLVAHIEQGRSARWIHNSFPSLSVKEISNVMAWYRDHKTEADEYILAGEIEAEKLRREIESEPRYIALTEKLRAIKAQRKAQRH